jgi:ubiquinone/menaquinone biosynthesis C-methylase UbiE
MMEKTIGFNKEELKNKFNTFYKDGLEWSFNVNDNMYLAKKGIIEPFIKQNQTILDLGCAEGNFLASIVNEKLNTYSIGVDIPEQAILMAKEKDFYNELYVGFIDDIELYTKKLKRFDVILLNEVLYYVDNYVDSLKKILTLQSKYIFVSLAMGPQFFSNNDANNIESIFKENGYKISKKNIYDMSYKFKIPIRYLTKLYEIFRGIKLKQTHKYIYIYEKID